MSEKNFNEVICNAKALMTEVEELSSGKTRLMAVTKFQPVEAIEAAVSAGISIIGESRAQEFRDKLERLDPMSIEKHFIGTLQKNKLKYVVGKADIIESVDSEELAEAISQFAVNKDTRQDIFIEVNAGREESKSGFEPEEVISAAERIASLPGVRLRGLMTMAPIASDLEVEQAFALAHKLFIDITNKKLDNVSMDFLSMGMSRDYKLAIKHGSNIVRLGRAIFCGR